MAGAIVVFDASSAAQTDEAKLWCEWFGSKAGLGSGQLALFGVTEDLNASLKSFSFKYVPTSHYPLHIARFLMGRNGSIPFYSQSHNPCPFVIISLSLSLSPSVPSNDRVFVPAIPVSLKSGGEFPAESSASAAFTNFLRSVARTLSGSAPAVGQ